MKVATLSLMLISNLAFSSTDIARVYICNGNYLSVKTLPQQAKEFQWGFYITMNTSSEDCQNNAIELNKLAAGKTGSYRVYSCATGVLKIKTLPPVANEFPDGTWVAGNIERALCERQAVELNKALESAK